MNINNTLFIVAFLLLPTTAVAADLHVGSGQTYTTIASAISASASGDIIYIHQGTYNEVNLQPKGGTTLSGVDGENRPVIDAQQSSFIGNHAYSAIHISGYNYNQDNVTLNKLDIRNGARSTVVVDNYTEIDTFTVTNCHLQVDDRSENPPDNAGLIWIAEGGTNITIKNNTFQMDTMEYVGVLLFEPEGFVIIENNEFDCNSETSSGVFFKHSGSGATRPQIRYNFFDYTGATGLANPIFISQDNADIKHNVVLGVMRSGIVLGHVDGGGGGGGSVVDHNTVYGLIDRAAFNVLDDGDESNITLTNNILYKTKSTTEYLTASWWVYGSDQTITSSDHNHYFQSAVGTSVIKTASTGTHTLAEWQGNTAFDANSINELHGFSNGSGGLNILSDFEVVSGGGNNAASDGSDMGANISLVGVNAGASNITCYPDADGDLYPAAGSETVETCSTNYYEASHFAAMTIDCNDTVATINPGSTEVCGDGIDNDCLNGDASCGGFSNANCQGGTVAASGGTTSVIMQ